MSHVFSTQQYLILHRGAPSTWHFSSRSGLFFLLPEVITTGKSRLVHSDFVSAGNNLSVRHYISSDSIRLLVIGSKLMSVSLRYFFSFYFFRFRLSTCQSEHLCELLVVFDYCPCIQTHFESAFNCPFLSLDEWKTKLPLWDDVLLSGTLLCWSDSVCWLPPPPSLFMTKFLRNLSQAGWTKLIFEASIIFLICIYFVSAEYNPLIVSGCTKILDFYYFFFFLNCRDCLFLTVFLAESKKDRMIEYCCGLHCHHFLQPRQQLSGVRAGELLQYFEIYTHTHTNILMWKAFAVCCVVAS